ncbi:MAG: presqualene diphosphate synthase HpnD [Defluviicoccus sp.]|nr:presqualene diphosphate synthase HpnD [Defluviicoccus sp.]MDE0275484.1 presqualene diphosphate synthase HpnD [Defluviicoccus sp.]
MRNGPERGVVVDDEARAHVRAVTVASGTSFYWAMRFLPRARREAMFAIYAFCREVDDIADDEGRPDDKRRRLDKWRHEIDSLYAGHPETLTARALAEPVRRFGMRREDFLAVIDGMEMDLGDGLRAPDLDELELYCRRVAGAVGLLSIRAFGAGGARAEAFAVALGTALQLTNILRDLLEDADRDRLYLPQELLDRAGIEASEPRDVLRHPEIPKVCDALARIAKERFAGAAAALEECDRRALRPAVVMMVHYRRLLEALEKRGWTRLDVPVRISRPEKILIAIRHGVFA